ncbi:CDP-diacylglycerol--glycerol-3-phosphate 3-phosphatidyltransferase [Clostridia bacterium]|nr:CDP-diacylglycerol--glycerol-3-phosphate 3-phosphatidyltransferase [Clostridia bacterium]
MNLPNKLTLFRVVLGFLIIPVILINFDRNIHIALFIFVIASVTDFLDGFIARKYRLITDLGKFLDPLADKILVIGTLICFIDKGWAESPVVALIVAREFVVSGVRLAAAADKTAPQVIAASPLGKIKTAATMVTIAAILLFNSFVQLPGSLDTDGIGHALLLFCLVLTVASGIEYVYLYRNVFKTK